MIDRDEFLWVEKYRPQTIEDVILPERIKAPFRAYVKNKQIPNMLLVGSPGVGKTTIALACVEEVGCDYIKINGSDENGIDTLRTKISSYASTTSLEGTRKVIVVDEADALTPQIQAGLRAAIEQYSKNCTFIFTANFKSKMTEAIQSRCPPEEFRLTGPERAQMAGAFFKRVSEILDLEKITFDPAVLKQVVIKYFPDYRQTLSMLQRYSVAHGKIDTGMLSNSTDDTVKDVVEFMKAKDYVKVRSWAAINAADQAHVYRSLYTFLEKKCEDTYPQAVLLIADYQYKAAFVADQEVNLVALLTELMLNCTFN
jgi:DNA polymerase III delta prime subunit